MRTLTPEQIADIVSQRKQGHTLRAIGKSYGIYPDRVRGICIREERRRERLKLLDGVPPLSVRTLNCIYNAGLDDYGREPNRETAQRLAAYGIKKLLETPNFGRRSLVELEAFVSHFGLTLGSGETVDEKQAKLEMLIKQRDALDAKIKKLQNGS